jgi:hypothetical protein
MMTMMNHMLCSSTLGGYKHRTLGISVRLTLPQTNLSAGQLLEMHRKENFCGGLARQRCRVLMHAKSRSARVRRNQVRREQRLHAHHTCTALSSEALNWWSKVLSSSVRSRWRGCAGLG